MATRLTTAARQLSRISYSNSSSTHLSSARPSHFLQRRGLAGSADHHGPPKVNCWQEPTNPGNWKEEHFVIVSLAGWGLLIFGGYKFFTGGKGKKAEVVEAKQ